MKQLLVVGSLLFALAPIVASAADPDPQSKSASAEKTAVVPPGNVTKPVIPKRELKFDVSDEQHPLPLNVPDPYKRAPTYKLEQLLEQNYVARFTLVATEAPYYHRHSGGAWTFRSAHFGESRLSADDVAKVRLVDLHETLFQRNGVVHSPQTSELLLGNLPQERRQQVPNVVVAMLTANPSLHVRVYPKAIRAEGAPELSPRASGEAATWHCDFQVLAPNAKEAREYVEGLLTVLDYGFFYPFQEECIRGRQAFAEDAAKYRAELKQLREDLAGYEKELEGLEAYKDIGREAAAEFTSQIRLISVEMAGVQARLDACDRILAAHEGSPTARTEQVETLKITAEIELVGLVARKAALGKIAKQGLRRNELVRKKGYDSRRAPFTETKVKEAEQGVAHYEAQRLRVVPFPVKDGKVTIRRIKWESGDDAPRKSDDG